MGTTFQFEWEVKLIEWIQSWCGEFGKNVFTVFTMLGEELIFILLLSFLYFCVNKQIAKRVAVNIFFAFIVFPQFKNLVQRRRPYFDNPNIECLKPVNNEGDIYDIATQEFSFPSGHSANALTAYGSTAHFLKKRWLYIVAIVATVLIGISRFSLGVHYPTDVLAGYALGFIIICVTNLMYKYIKNEWIIFGILFAITIPGYFYCTTNDFFTGAGMLYGGLLGLKFEEKFVNFKETHNFLNGLLRIVLTVLVYLLLNTLFKLPFSSEFLSSGTFLSSMVRVIRYTIVVFVVIGLDPLLFKYFDKVKFLKDKES